MKVTLRNLALLLAFFWTSTPIFAQTQIGFKVGLQSAGIISDFQVGNYKPAKFVNTPELGLIMEFGLGEHFSLQPELNYVSRGFKVQEGFNFDVINVPLDVGVKLVTKINQVNLPILAKYKFGNDRVKGYVLAGPEMGYALNGRFKTKAHVLVDFTILDEKLNLSKGGFQRFEVGATAGAGVTLNTGQGELFFDARYYRGFTELVDLPIIEVPIKNQGFQFNVGYLFPLGGSSSYASR